MGEAGEMTREMKQIPGQPTRQNLPSISSPVGLLYASIVYQHGTS